ncbi:hypothetical protein FA95DRAFT_1525797 [Auriscalpium vulgare]|uniref:Uncharacterized protein n=1 Tax=Auriscalpium vulgare TaxID=40419 RepID=A0ACB8RDR2_9AGAM|nr:hypothetical protein FA95DRAFT_1525797 [Auriscalpium vulgare]
MTHITELWLTYHQASRANKPSTAQLVELTTDGHCMHDLEDVLDHVFQHGFVDAKWRSVAWWEQCDGTKVKASHVVQDLLSVGAGRSPETALRLVIADIPSAVWIKYVYLHTPRAHSATQRVRLDLPHAKFERLAHVTNYVFAQGYLPANMRSLVYWQGICGKQVDENAKVEEVLSWGEGVSEDKALRLIIDH